MKDRNRKAGADNNTTAPRLVGEILHNYLENSNEPLAVAFREQSAEAEGWKRNTDLCMDVKTFLRSDRIAEIVSSLKGLIEEDVLGE